MRRTACEDHIKENHQRHQPQHAFDQSDCPSLVCVCGGKPATYTMYFAKAY